MTRIFHITERNCWQQAELEGEYRPASLGQEGFIHCSLPHQLAGVANALFRGQRGLVCLVIDPERVRAPVRYEALGTEELYPHIYGPLNLDAVIGVLDFDPGEDGRFSLPEPLR